MRAIMPWINAIGLAFVIVMNFLAERVPWGGKTTGEIAAQYPVLIQPASYAFGIWTAIYALLIGFVVYSFTRGGRLSPAVRSVGIYFPISCLLNVAWLWAWHGEKLTASVLVMFSLLLSLIAIYIRVRSRTNEPISKPDRLWGLLPFSLYLGWISVASIVNVAVALYASDWDRLGLSEEAWTIIMLAVATLLGLIIGWRYRDWAYSAALVWAFIAIGVANKESHPLVARMAYLLALLLLGFALYWLIGSNNRILSRRRVSA